MSDNNISIIEQYLGKHPWFSEGYLDLYKAMCSLEGDVGLTYLNKAASHVWSRSRLYEIYKESLIEQADVVDTPAVVAEIPAEVAEEPAVVVEIHPQIVVETPAVVIDSPAVVVETPVQVVETPTVVIDSPAVVEETRVPEEEDEPVSEKPAEPKLERAAKPVSAPTYREYELIQLDEEEDLGRDIVFEDNSFVITENKPKFVLAGGDYFTKKDFEMIELDLTQPLDHFIAEKPTLLRSAIIGKGSKPVVINDTESAESLDDEAFYTETLASIYIEQGFYKRALDVYAKLILLFPEKSSYFATLVKEIKNKYNT